MHDELLRYIDTMHKEKGIDPDIIFESVETALVSAARKKYPHVEELRVRINRQNGRIDLMDGDIPFDVMEPSAFGRVAAQTAKQVMIQRIREAESEVVYGEFAAKTGTLVNGIVQRVEARTVICNIGKTDAILPRQEQIPSETYHPGERLRCYVTQVRKKGSKVMVVLSRTHPDLVRELFEMEVPEIYDHIVEIKGLVREPGYRTKIAVLSSDSRVDPVGACVGVRGSRIRNIVEELGGEKIDIVRWAESPELFIRNALSPAEIASIEFDKHHARARVIVPEDQLSLAIGRKGQNVRLSSRLTGWNLDIMTIDQHRGWREKGRAEISSLPGMDEALANNLLMTGFESFRDILELGADKLAEIPGIDAERAQAYYNSAVEGHRLRLENDAREAQEARQRKEQDAAHAALTGRAPADPSESPGEPAEAPTETTETPAASPASEAVGAPTPDTEV